MKIVKKTLRTILFFIPGALGFVGLFLLTSPPESLGDAIFHSIKMYLFAYVDSPPNVLVELARWTAPLCTASGAAMAISAARARLRRYLRYRSGSSVAVYGPEPERERLLAQLDKRGIDGGERFVRAQRYVLLWEDEQSLAFYERHKDRFKNTEVYIRCDAIPTQVVSEPQLHLFCPEETAARDYWKQRNVYPLFASDGPEMKIVLLGFGKLGEEVLNYALLDNIFSPAQRIEYHVFGDGARFNAVHHQLSAITDPVLFHSEPWYESLSLLEQASMVVVLTQQDQLSLLRDMLFALHRPVIDVFAADTQSTHLLEDQGRLRLYDWKQEAMQIDDILGDRLTARAKRINLRYASIYGGVPETAQASEEEWGKLNAFTRYSNISAADYHDIRLQMLSAMGIPSRQAAQSPETIDMLAELEHIRWCRYHFLHNWRCGVPEGGGTKDAVRRIHADLIPYDRLSEAEKQKDRDSTELLLGMEP